MENKRCLHCGTMFGPSRCMKPAGWKVTKFCSRRCGGLARATPAQKQLKNYRVDQNGCWLWLGSVGKDGYGRLTIRNRSHSAHRQSYLVHVGNIGPGLCACHRCDVRLCINPEHLFLGTQADNNADMDSKGRRRIVRGERRGNTKLTDAEVQRLRSMDFSRWGALTEEARRMGLDTKTVWSAVVGETWTHLPVPPNQPRARFRREATQAPQSMMTSEAVSGGEAPKHSPSSHEEER